MQLAYCPKLDYLRQAMDYFAAELANRKSGLIKRLLRPFNYVACYVVLRINVRRMEKVARLSEYHWQILLSDYRSRKYLFPNDDPASRTMRESARESRQVLEDVLANIALIEDFFPKLVPRMRIAVERTKKIQCEYVPALYSEVDAEKIIEAKQHYEQGTLMDIETFANAIHGH